MINKLARKKSKPDDNSKLIIFYQDKLVFKQESNEFFLNYQDLKSYISVNDTFLIGYKDNIEIYACAANTDASKYDESISLVDLRFILSNLEQDEFLFISRAKQIIYWSQNAQFCGVCGKENLFSDKEGAFYCECRKTFNYPAISPCIITLIHRNNKILLGRNAYFPKDMFSTLAGFIEAGESCEEALEREVFEEVGIEVKNIRYFGSQTWPFPAQLMIGFYAEYSSGEITLDEDELEEAYWFDVSNLPNIPPKESISGQLIRSYIEDH